MNFAGILCLSLANFILIVKQNNLNWIFICLIFVEVILNILIFYYFKKF